MFTFNLKHLAVPALMLASAVPLAGCPVITDQPLPYPVPPTQTPVAAQAGGGLGLADAFHQAQHYFATQHEDVQFISAHADAVDQDGISGAGGWKFVFAVSQPVAVPLSGGIASQPPQGAPCVAQVDPPAQLEPPSGGSAATGSGKIAPAPMDVFLPPPSPAPVPCDSPYPIPVDPPVSVPQEISLQVDGQGNVMAPQNLTQSGDPTLSFRQTVGLESILSTVQDLGSPTGPSGYAVSLRTDSQHGPVFEVDPDVTYRDNSGGVAPAPAPMPAPTDPASCYCDGPVETSDRAPVYMQSLAMPHPTAYYGDAQAAYRGTYLFDAYSGDILARPTRL